MIPLIQKHGPSPQSDHLNSAHNYKSLIWNKPILLAKKTKIAWSPHLSKNRLSRIRHRVSGEKQRILIKQQEFEIVDITTHF
jgi:hypothetical protein